MRLTIVAVMAAGGLLVSIDRANAQQIGECLLQVSRKTYIDGRCPISMQRDGSFTIGASEQGIPAGYFAVVNFERKGVAAGFWNEEKGANHAHTPLGPLSQQGACWTNAQAKVCAWKLGSRTRTR